MKKINLLYILLVFNAFDAQSQIFPYINYTTENGLSSNTIFYFEQDKIGFIWFGTDNGLNKFDGSEFTKYTIVEGLLGNNINGLEILNDSILFVSCYGKGINILKNDKIDTIRISNPSDLPLSNYLTHKNEKIFLMSRKSIFMLKKDNFGSYFITTFKRPRNIDEYYVYNYFNSDKTGLLFCTSEGIFKYDNDSLDIYSLIPGIENVYSIQSTLDKGIWLCTTGKFINVKDRIIANSINYSIPTGKTIVNFLVDTYSNIWLYTLGGGLYVLKNGEFIDISQKLRIQNTQINFIKEDREKNIWVGTFGKGVYCFYNTAFTNYDDKDMILNDYIQRIVKIDDKRIAIGTFNGLGIYNGKEFLPVESPDKNLINNVKNIEVIDNKEIFASISGISTNNYTNAFKTSLDGLNFNCLNASTIYHISRDTVMFGFWNNILIKCVSEPDRNVPIDTIYLGGKSLKSMRINRMLPDENGNLWVATTAGLHVIHPDYKQDNFSTYPMLNTSINDIHFDNNKRLWVATDGGLAINDGKVWKFIENIENHKITTVKAIDFDNDGNAWIGSAYGVDVIPISNEFRYPDTANRLKCINKYSGLISDVINDICYQKYSNEMWIGTDRGITKIELSKLLDSGSGKPVVYFTKATTSDSEYVKPIELDLSYRNSRLSVYYSSIHFKSALGTTYEFRFENDNEWNKTKNRMLDLEGIGSGKHIVYLRAITNDGEYSNTVQLNINIGTPFWKTNIFYLCCSLIIIILLTLYFRWLIDKKYRVLTEKNAIEYQVSELKIQALTTMMNPHFIFNALNSIQSLINQGKNQITNQYIAKFSRLIRKNLLQARSSFVSIHDEIDKLLLYIEIEKLRFGNKLNYEIFIDHDIDAEKTTIPNMIIQPFVENAIQHGILPKIEGGFVNIKIMKDEIIENGQSKNEQNKRGLKIMIIDNGIGIAAAVANKKPEHSSLSINVIKERLGLLDKKNGDKDLIKVYQNPEMQGTITEIYLSPNICSIIYKD